MSRAFVKLTKLIVFFLSREDWKPVLDARPIFLNDSPGKFQTVAVACRLRFCRALNLRSVGFRARIRPVEEFARHEHIQIGGGRARPLCTNETAEASKHVGDFLAVVLQGDAVDEYLRDAAHARALEEVASSLKGQEINEV